ncbi:uncharacterized protein LOC131010524 isoform X2 [Salvia miltiorrhiza]|uniref:uncharacterized protein LOC131010524 isoform X2 n=1 Tax=Salvia miltiorrhiza TaxID=226208 RepID=UPI0025ABEAC3|nr:uncharacterized protein LOC131010524 isoform X2 [Salvia miltiorrhiza]
MLSPVIASLFPAAAPPPAHSQPPPPQLSQPEISTVSRRAAAVLLSSVIIPILRPPLASAFSIGISGPKEWLKEQKKKSSKFLLAPVDASRNILQSAYLLLKFGESELDEVQNLLVSAARDCVPQDRNSFVEFQASTGVEVCTFKLIVKNASSLLGDRDPLKLEAESKLNDLIRSFSSLSDMAREGSVQLTLNSKQRVVDALKDTISSLNSFEQGIMDCLQV